MAERMLTFLTHTHVRSLILAHTHMHAQSFRPLLFSALFAALTCGQTQCVCGDQEALSRALCLGSGCGKIPLSRPFSFGQREREGEREEQRRHAERDAAAEITAPLLMMMMTTTATAQQDQRHLMST